MKILFICSSLEPKQDGVGDYTRKLAHGLIQKGHVVKIIALNDRRMQEESWQGVQKDDDTAIEVFRLSEALPWNIRLQSVKNFTADFKPEWISLQFVPFGYQIKGLPFNLDRKLKKITASVKWHVMFHELSVNKNESIKFKLWGYLQEKIIKSLLRGLHPAIITTNTEVYKYSLQKLGYHSMVLPLFSNINYRENNQFYSDPGMIPEFLKQDKSSYCKGTLFGTFSFKSWNMHSLLRKLLQQYNNRKIVITSIGKMSSGSFYWHKLKEEYPQIVFVELGIQTSEFISYWLLNYTDFGILTTLPELSGKSGSFMAFKEHGIPVLCKQPDGQLDNYNIVLDPCLTTVKDDDSVLKIPSKSAPYSMLENTVNRFIELLNNNY